MVNLALTGRASSNVFDGNKQLDSTTLRGIQSRFAGLSLCIVLPLRHPPCYCVS